MLFLAATKQLSERFSPSIHPSVLHTILNMFPSSYHHEIFSHGQRSKVKVTEVKKLSNFTQIGRFRTVTPVWIHQWLQNDAQSLK